MSVEMTIAGTRLRLIEFRKAGLERVRERRVPWNGAATRRDDQMINVLDSAFLVDRPGSTVLCFSDGGNYADLEAVFSEIRTVALTWDLRIQAFGWDLNDTDQYDMDRDPQQDLYQTATRLLMDGWVTPSPANPVVW